MQIWTQANKSKHDAKNVVKNQQRVRWSTNNNTGSFKKLKSKTQGAENGAKKKRQQRKHCGNVTQHKQLFCTGCLVKVCFYVLESSCEQVCAIKNLVTVNMIHVLCVVVHNAHKGCCVFWEAWPGSVVRDWDNTLPPVEEDLQLYIPQNKKMVIAALPEHFDCFENTNIFNCSTTFCAKSTKLF